MNWKVAYTNSKFETIKAVSLKPVPLGFVLLDKDGTAIAFFNASAVRYIKQIKNDKQQRPRKASTGSVST